MSAQLFQFPVAAVQNTFEDGWAILPTTMKTRSLSRAKLRPIWDAAAKRVGGHDILLSALQSYLKGDKDLPKSGGPALDRWLKNEKYDHWLVEGSSVVVAQMNGEQAPRFPEPFRASLVASCGETWVVSYIDRFKLDGTVLVVSSKTAASRIREKADAMKVAGLTALRLDPPKG